MQRALIVDDSKTAQARLRTMLSSYDLTVDTALSAEQALGYLSYNHPDIVFMDHHMAGMDGLEALKIIKGNPSTATIPVVMYTAEKGDVYVDQARALGALDILSKEIIRPGNLEELLQKLKIHPSKKDDSSSEKSEPVEAPKEPVAEKPPVIEEPPIREREVGTRSFEGEFSQPETSGQIARLFELHISDVRQQIENSSRMVVRNLRAEIGKSNQKKPPTEPDKTEEELALEASYQAPTQQTTSVLPVLLLLIALCGLGYLVFENRQVHGNLQAVTKQIDSLVESNSLMQRELSNRNFSALEARTQRAVAPIVAPDTGSAPSYDDDLHQIINWAVAYDFSFAYGEDPLSVEQVGRLEEFVRLLADASYEGIIDIDIRFANYCLVEDGFEEWVLAPPDTIVQDCVFLEDLPIEYPIDDYLSLAFLNFERYTSIEVGEDIQISVTSVRVAGEAGAFGAQTAGEWNEAIAKENRLVISL